jgi:hypothetical protein
LEVFPETILKLRRYRKAPRQIIRLASSRADRLIGFLRERRDNLQKDAAARRRRNRIGQLETARSAVTLFVAPEAGLSPFFGAHALIAHLLADAGFGAIMLSCNGLLPVCSTKFAMGMGATAAHDVNNAACIRCLEQAQSVGISYDLSDVSIDKTLNASQQADIELLMSESSVALWELKYDGIDFGALSLGETLRAVRKASVADFTSGDHALLRALLVASLSIYFAVRSLLSRFNVRHIAYYGDYAYHLPLVVLASRAGIVVTHISHGYTGDVDQRYLSLRPGVAVAHAMDLVDRWPKYRQRPLAPLEVERLYDGALFRLLNHGGISTYSPVWTFRDGDMRAELGLDPARKTIVAFPSSMDEIVCTRLFMQAMNVDFGSFKGAFVDHDDWLQKLIQWVSGRKDLQLVVRLHPRMASGARYKSVASGALRSRDMLANPPANVVIEWPESKISSYALAEVADVAVTAWSSMALELSRLGLPVVSAFPDIGLAPVGGFIGGGQTAEAFFQEVVRSASRGSSLAEITDSLRWTYIQHWSHLVDVSDVAPSHSDVPPYKRPSNAKTIIDVVAGGKDLVEINMSRHESDACAFSQEKEAVIRALEKMIGLFGAGRMLDEGQGLQIVGEGRAPIYRSPHREADVLTLRLSEDGIVKSENKEGVIARYSKVVYRLSNLLRDTQGNGIQKPIHEQLSLQART